MEGRAEGIEELRALIAEQAAKLEQQAAQWKQQAARMAELEVALAKAKRDSSTSSKPPSSDLTTPSPTPQRPGQRKKPRCGAQPGHQRQGREPLPPERVDETLADEIADHDRRRLNLTPTGAFESIQRTELPDTPVQVTAHRLAVDRAPAGRLYLPDVPALQGPIFGSRLLATLGWLKSVGHLRDATVAAWREDGWQAPVSRGKNRWAVTRRASKTTARSTGFGASRR